MLGEGIRALNVGINEVHRAIISDPIARDKCLLSVIQFNQRADVVFDLQDSSLMVSMPSIDADGLTNYGSAFQTLRQTIDRDIAQLSAEGEALLRPLVFMITDGAPNDERWRQDLEKLLDPSEEVSPLLVFYGVGKVPPNLVAEVSTVPGMTRERVNLVTTGGNIAIDVTTTFNKVIGSIVGSVRDGEDNFQLEINEVDRISVIPFYIVCDESQSMGAPGIDSCNAALPNIHAAIGSDPFINDRIRIGVISFSDTAEALLPLSKMTDVVDFPGLVAKGGTNYGNAFTLLKNTIQTDMVDLQKSGAKMCRPIVLFMTDGEPTDTNWKEAHAQVADKTWPFSPHIISFGLSGAQADTIREVATQVDKKGTSFAYLADDDASGAGLREIFNSLLSPILRDECLEGR
jgi:uncharacterized protein YegL